MLRMVMAVAAFGLIAAFNMPTEVRADTWGCDYAKCLAACAKAGGKWCPQYCDGRMREKRRDKVCS